LQDGGRPASLKVGLWCNWIFVVLTAVGWLGIAHYWAPARADLGLEATKVWFTDTQRAEDDGPNDACSSPRGLCGDR
jgi:hypothetical protein